MTLASVAATPSLGHASGVSDVRASTVELTALAQPRSVVVTLASSGETRVLHLGEGLVVRLTGPSMYTWTAPSSSRPRLLARVSSSSGSVGAATFLARSPGRVLVSAVDTPNCYPQCLPPSRVFTLHVVILR